MEEMYKFDAEKHRHYIKNELGVYRMVPGVTTISGMIDDGKSNALMGWAAKLTASYIGDNLQLVNGKTYVGDMELTPDTAGKILSLAKKSYKGARDGAADLGTRVHTLCEHYWAYKEVAVKDDERGPYEAFVRWIDRYEVIMIRTEAHVYSLLHRYGGIFDLLAKVNGLNYLVDIKTSNRISPGFLIQVGGYAIAFTEMTGEAISHAGIVRLDKAEGTFEWMDLSADLERAKSDFRACLSIYNNLKKYRKTIQACVAEGDMT